MTFKSGQFQAILAGGAGNSDAWDYLDSSDGATSVDSYGFVPVNGDVTLTELKEDGTSVGATKLAYTYYQNVFYPGNFDSITVDSGTLMYFKNK